MKTINKTILFAILSITQVVRPSITTASLTSNPLKSVVAALSTEDVQTNISTAMPGMALGAILTIAGYLAYEKAKETIITHKEAITQGALGVATFASVPYIYGPVKEFCTQYPAPILGAFLAATGINFASYAKEKARDNAVFLSAGVATLTAMGAYFQYNAYMK